MGEGFCVDLSKPLVFQVGHLGERYQKWVHQPIVSKDSPRFFASDFCESFTRTVWWVIPIVWLPVVLWTQYLSLQRGLPLGNVLSTLCTGMLLWSFLEYTLHRFLFHVKTTTYWGNTFHYLLHGCHHKHPMDGYRLVFPPAFTALFCAFFWSILRVACPYTAAPSVFGGGLLGYVIYDVTHYCLHHGAPVGLFFKKLKRYHLNHHFKVQTDGFGITSSLWDRVFGTLPSGV